MKLKGLAFAILLGIITLSCTQEEKREEVQKTQLSCPSELVFGEKIKQIVGPDWKVVEVTPIEDLNLCAIAVKRGLKTFILYMDPKMNYLISGNVIDMKNQVNLTRSLAEKHNYVTKDTLKELEKLVDLKFNEGKEKYVYFISDPDCPFCRRIEPMLKEWAQKNNVEIRHIFYPLPMHPKAKDKAIDIICTGKGYEYVHKDFEPENLCEEGKKKVEKNIEFLSKLGVSGTPTLIGMNGKVIVGLPPDESHLNVLIR